jgi:hypothetical protein
VNSFLRTALALLFSCFAISGFGRLRPVVLPSAALPTQVNSNSNDSVAEIRFSYENPKLQPVKYVLQVREDGSGHYHSEGGNVPSEDKTTLPVLGQDRDIQISKNTREKMFAGARHSNYFNISCDASEKHMAFQGMKTLEYLGPDGHGRCTYNWSKVKQIDMLTSEFEGISLTLEEGARLETQYEHSRLSLDAELDEFSQLAQQGRALELSNIAPCLEKIANDQAILKRAQRRANELLDMAKAN